MFKKILRWTMITVGSLLAIIIIVCAIVYFKTEERINTVYAVNAPTEPVIPDISSTGQATKWQAGGFITALRSGKTPEGKQLNEAMPWKFLTFTDDELKAIHLYLQQQ